MNIFKVSTNGQKIKVNYSEINSYKALDNDVANLWLEIGGVIVNIRFDSGEEMISFCKKHNFEYKDKREKVTEQETLDQVISVTE